MHYVTQVVITPKESLEKLILAHAEQYVEDKYSVPFTKWKESEKEDFVENITETLAKEYPLKTHIEVWEKYRKPGYVKMPVNTYEHFEVVLE